MGEAFRFENESRRFLDFLVNSTKLLLDVKGRYCPEANCTLDFSRFSIGRNGLERKISFQTQEIVKPFR